jgi:hypothetical protein
MNPDPADPPNVEALKKEALDVGIRLAPFSHWPVHWHPLVMRVLKAARHAGITELYIKEKFFGMRIQGGEHVELEIAIQAEQECWSICVYCGNSCEPPKTHTFPSCEACHSLAESKAAFEWVKIGDSREGT